MMADDVENDPVLAALSELSALDVDARRAQHLGARCRSELARRSRRAAASDSAERVSWILLAGRALVAIWCAVYAIEIVRHAATVYGW